MANSKDGAIRLKGDSLVALYCCLQLFLLSLALDVFLECGVGDGGLRDFRVIDLLFGYKLLQELVGLIFYPGIEINLWHGITPL